MSSSLRLARPLVAFFVCLGAICLLPGCGRSAGSSFPTSEPPVIETRGPNRDVLALAKQLLADWNRPQVPVPLERKWVSPESLSTVKYAVFSKDGSRLAVYTGSEIIVIDAATGQTVWKKSGQLEFANGAISLAISPNGQRVMMDCVQTNVVETWDTTTGKLVGSTDRKSPVHFAGTSANENSVFAMGHWDPQRSATGSEQNIPKSYEIFWTDGLSQPIPTELGKLYVESIKATGTDERYLLMDQFGGVHLGKRNGTEWTTEVTCIPPPDEVFWNNRQRVQQVAEAAAADSNSNWLIAGRNRQWNIVPIEQLNRAKDGLIEIPEMPKAGDRAQVDLKSIAAGIPAGSQSVRDARLSPDGKHVLLIGLSLNVVPLERPGYSIPTYPLGTSQESPQPIAISYDAKFVATKVRVKNGISIALHQVGEIPPSRGQRVEDWARKALEEEDYDLINAVLSAAAADKTAPAWLVTDLPSTEASPLRSAIVHVLRESNVPVWARRYREKSDAWANRVGRPANGDYIDKKDPAKATLGDPVLVNGEPRFEDNPEAQRLVERIINTFSATPEESAKLLMLARKGVIPRPIFVNASHSLSRTVSIDDPSVPAIPAAMLEAIIVDGTPAPATFPIAFINVVLDNYEVHHGPRAANRALATFCVDLARRRQLSGYGGMAPSGATSIGQTVPEETALNGDYDETRGNMVGAMNDEQEFFQSTAIASGQLSADKSTLYFQRKNNSLRREIVRDHFEYRRVADGLLQLLSEAPQGTDLKATSDEFYDADTSDHRDVAMVAIRVGYDAGDKELVRAASEVFKRYSPSTTNPALFPVYRYDLPAIIEWAKTP
jgi:hypothetical protein